MIYFPMVPLLALTFKKIKHKPENTTDKRQHHIFSSESLSVFSFKHWHLVHGSGQK